MATRKPGNSRPRSAAVGTMGWVMYEGPSLLDGEPIVVIATRFSGNGKTGETSGKDHEDRNMVQTWILRSDMAPTTAHSCNADKSVCGNCPMRKAGCYVEIGKAPGHIWRSYKAGKYESEIEPSDVAHRAMRLGSYGDPAAAPIEVFERVLPSRHTGYTHQWRECDQRWSEYLMASVENASEMREAQAAGWRTFRVKGENEQVQEGEIECPASKSDKVKCIKCGLCNGNAGDCALSSCINGHGKDASKIDARNGR